MRTISSSLLAALMVVALFWGNCFSCPQVLLAAAGHGCCHRTRQVSRGCSNQAVRHFVKAEAETLAAPAPAGEALAPAPVATSSWEPAWEVIPAGHAPPDLLALHSTFRI